jgi:prepilin signal peptidase PulO-like enzyme (type II secretory pathway)
MILTATLVVLVGLCVGSYLNVVILRTHADLPSGGRSRCMSCSTELRPRDLIPVLSFLMLQGKCRTCGAKISVQYPLVEFGTAMLFLAFYLRFVFGVGLPPGISAYESVAFLIRDLAFVPFLVVLFVYDLRYQLILDRFTVPAMVIAFLLNLWVGYYPPEEMFAGAFAVGGFFLFQYVISGGRWIGGGDIRMGLLMGFMLGFKDALGALFISYALGALVGIFLITREKAEWRTRVPFGTFLAMGTLVMLLAGRPLMDWYLGFFAV